MAKLETDQKRKPHYALIKNQLKRIGYAGIDWALESKTIKRIKAPNSKVPLYELRCLPETTRVMVHLHPRKKDRLVVLLFDFKGHKAGKSMGGIRKQDVQRGMELAAIAQELMKAEEAEGHEEPKLDI